MENPQNTPQDYKKEIFESIQFLFLIEISLRMPYFDFWMEIRVQ